MARVRGRSFGSGGMHYGDVDSGFYEHNSGPTTPPRAPSAHEAAEGSRRSAIATPHVTGHHDHTTGGETSSAHAHAASAAAHDAPSHTRAMEAHYAAAHAHSASFPAAAHEHGERALEHRRAASAAASTQTGKRGGTFVVTAGGKKNYHKKR